MSLESARGAGSHFGQGVAFLAGAPGGLSPEPKAEGALGSVSCSFSEPRKLWVGQMGSWSRN